MNTKPLVTVVSGTPTTEELAALVAALATRRAYEPTRGRSTAAGPDTAGAWVAQARPRGPGLPARGWRASGLPH